MKKKTLLIAVPAVIIAMCLGTGVCVSYAAENNDNQRAQVVAAKDIHDKKLRYLTGVAKAADHYWFSKDLRDEAVFAASLKKSSRDGLDGMKSQQDWIAIKRTTVNDTANITSETTKLQDKIKTESDAIHADMVNKINDASQKMKDSDGKVTDNKVREDLQNAINAASKDDNLKLGKVQDWYNARKNITDNIAKVDESMKAWQDAENARIAAEQAAAASAAYAGTSYAGGSGSYYGGGSSYSGDYSNGGGAYHGGSNGYSVGGNCYSVGQCQSAIDSAGYNTMEAFQTAGGSTYYGIHNGNGGSSMWGPVQHDHQWPACESRQLAAGAVHQRPALR